MNARFEIGLRRERAAAAADAIAHAAGVTVHDPHPLAVGMSLRAAAEAIGATRLRPDQPAGAALAAGMATSDFSAALADSLKVASIAAFDAAAAHRAFCGSVEVTNFQETEILPLEVGPVLINEVREGGEIPTTALQMPARSGSARLRTYGGLYRLGRALVINSELGPLVRSLNAAAVAAAAKEASLLAQLLETNPTMPDGKAAFDDDFGNIESTALSATNLGNAIAKLRKQSTATGVAGNLAAAHLVVAPELEFTAQGILHQAGAGNIRLHALAGLTSGRWFVLADPAVCSAVSLLGLAGARHPVRVEPLRYDFTSDSLSFRLTADLGSVFARRVGIVRGGE